MTETAKIAECQFVVFPVIRVDGINIVERTALVVEMDQWNIVELFPLEVDGSGSRNADRTGNDPLVQQRQVLMTNDLHAVSPLVNHVLERGKRHRLITVDRALPGNDDTDQQTLISRQQWISERTRRFDYPLSRLLLHAGRVVHDQRNRTLGNSCPACHHGACRLFHVVLLYRKDITARRKIQVFSTGKRGNYRFLSMEKICLPHIFTL